jgi:hypothetical protein
LCGKNTGEGRKRMVICGRIILRPPFLSDQLIYSPIFPALRPFRDNSEIMLWERQTCGRLFEDAEINTSAETEKAPFRLGAVCKQRFTLRRLGAEGWKRLAPAAVLAGSLQRLALPASAGRLRTFPHPRGSNSASRFHLQMAEDSSKTASGRFVCYSKHTVH